MLWNVVYEFFVKYIFGGYLVNTDGTNFRSYGAFFSINDTSFITTKDVVLNISNGSYSIRLGNYLSLIATIITMVVILVLCCALIKKIYNMCAHIIG